MTVEQNRRDGFVAQIAVSGSGLNPGLGYLCVGGWTANAEMY
jgi:hypothetical protein